jgi:hypothetical protein
LISHGTFEGGAVPGPSCLRGCAQALHLIAEMLRPQPEERRPIEELLRHPWWLQTRTALPFCLMPLYGIVFFKRINVTYHTASL